MHNTLKIPDVDGIVCCTFDSYSLWLMECSHDSSRCHAAMFFGQSFPYRVILNLFDQKDGLRTLFNVVSMQLDLHVVGKWANFNLFKLPESLTNVKRNGIYD